MAASAAVGFYIRWREAGTSTWSVPVYFKRGAEYVITAPDRDRTYNVQAQAVSACGARSTWADQADVAMPDANQRVSQGNINMLRTGGVGSAWTGFSISYTSTPTSATISCTSGTLQDAANNPSYAAASVVVSGTASTTVTYYLYYDDPAGLGGTFALGATTVYSDLAANQGRICVGVIDVAFPATGTGGGSGNPGGGGGTGCVDVDCLVLVIADDGSLDTKRAGDIVVGDTLLLADEVTLEPRVGLVSYSATKLQPCVEITAAGGARLPCSTSAPIPTPRGLVDAPHVAGRSIAVRDATGDSWRPATTLRALGLRKVQHISCNNGSFWAAMVVNGDIIGWILHHNLKPALDP